MKRGTKVIVLVVTVLVGGWWISTTGGRLFREHVAPPCDGQCCFGMHTGEPGACAECAATTPFDSHAICTQCAQRKNRCTHCRRPIARQ